MLHKVKTLTLTLTHDQIVNPPIHNYNATPLTHQQHFITAGRDHPGRQRHVGHAQADHQVCADAMECCCSALLICVGMC
jgi:hypothetical protein